MLIIYSIASKCLIPKCCGLFDMWFTRQWIEWHHISTCLRDNIVSGVGLKKVVDGFTVQGYSALLLTLAWLIDKGDAWVDCSGCRSLHKSVTDTGWPLHVHYFYPTPKLNAHRSLRIEFESINYSSCHFKFHLQALGTLSDALSVFS